MEEKRAKRRPLAIPIVCVLGFVTVALGTLNLTTAGLRQELSLFQAYYTVFVAGNLAGYSGLWRMKKWGVPVYAVNAVIGLIVFALVTNMPLRGHLIGSLIPAAVIGIGLFHFSRMD
jgi:hypothetical protein